MENMNIKKNIKNFLKLPNALMLAELGLSFIDLMLLTVATCEDPDEYMIDLKKDEFDIFSLETVGIIEEINSGEFQAHFMTFHIFTTYGFFFFIIVQMVATLSGDKFPTMRFLIATCGFLFYLAAGSKVIDIFNHNDEKRVRDYLNHTPEGRRCKKKFNGLGSMDIITSLIFLADAVMTGLALRGRLNENFSPN